MKMVLMNFVIVDQNVIYGYVIFSFLFELI